jgi:hypothetical protein
MRRSGSETVVPADKEIRRFVEPSHEECRVHVMRYKHRATWLAKAKGGDPLAGLCISAISRWLNAMLTEYSACACCDKVFPDSDFPRAFLVLIPVEHDPEHVKAMVDAVCRYCSENDDQWLVDQSVDRVGLSAAPRRGNDQIH